MHKVTRAIALLLLGSAVLLAILAVGLGRRTGRTKPQPVTVAAPARSLPAQAASVPVVVAAAALTAGAPIPARALRLASWTQSPPGGYGDIEAVAGDIPLRDLPAGTPVTAGLLARGLALQLKPGERALAVPVDELAGAGNRIVPGDYVDVFFSLKAASRPALAPAGQSQDDDMQARLLLSRLRVLAYGVRDLPALADGATPPSEAGTTATENTNRRGDANAVARTAVLAVPVEDAGRLLLGAQSGKLFLALRHPADPGFPDDSLFAKARDVLAPLPGLSAGQRQALTSPENRAYAGIDVDALAGRATARPSPASRRFGTPPGGIEIIRGDQRAEARAAARTSSL
jgi:pilus assembly protein CpaB